MKKITMLSAAVLLICGLVTGCGAGSSVVGTWYSDRDDEAALVLNKQRWAMAHQWQLHHRRQHRYSYRHIGRTKQADNPDGKRKDNIALW